MSEDNSSPQKKFAPSISQIISAAKRLPPPETYDKTSFPAFIDGKSGKQINFERIKIVKPDGTKVVNWSFKGRIMIESKYAGQKKASKI